LQQHQNNVLNVRRNIIQKWKLKLGTAAKTGNTKMNQPKSDPRSPAQPPKQKICEACGTQFPCASPWGPCWCEDVKVSTQTLAELRACYDECLCPKCLTAAASAAKSGPVVS
jgi:hypothetical protein